MARMSLVFSGHMVDLPTRETPRFPTNFVPSAERQIAKVVREQISGLAKEEIRAFSSLARGGDIIFSEICRNERVRSIVILPFPPQQFLETSVGDSDEWSIRFKKAWESTPSEDRYVLDQTISDDAYVSCNEMIIELAAAWGEIHPIVLWNREDNGRKGGTGDLVRRLREIGIKPLVIDPSNLR